MYGLAEKGTRSLLGIQDIPLKPRGKTVKGKWGATEDCPGLTAGAVAMLMDCAVHTAKRYLYKLRDHNEVVTMQLIGKMIWLYHETRREKALVRELKNLGIDLKN